MSYEKFAMELPDRHCSMIQVMDRISQESLSVIVNKDSEALGTRGRIACRFVLLFRRLADKEMT